MAYVLKSSKRSMVPWFSMGEWEEVYKQVYSGEPLLVKKGYEKMLMWKTRIPSLPAGVECTLSLVHVWLQDRELRPQVESGVLPPYREHDLRLAFSTAIMRFLNQISIVAQDGSETMYKMAKKLHIPDWVVTIRHDVAHGLSLPPLTVLREAMQFALIWIHENYWKGEAELTENFITDVDDRISGKLGNTAIEYMELWLALKLYEQSDHATVVSIPDHRLKLKLKKLIESNLEKGYQLLPLNSTLNGNESNQIVINKWTTLELLDQIMNHFKIFLSTNCKSINNEQLVLGILESETFIPDNNVLSALYLEDEERGRSLPIRLIHLWQEMILALQKLNILTILLQKLIDLTSNKEEVSHRKHTAALWVKELCIAIAKVRKLTKFREQYTQPNSDEDVLKKKGKKAMKNCNVIFDRMHPELGNIMTLSQQHLPVVSSDFVQQKMLKPSTSMHIYITSLLELVEPRLTNEIKSNLYNLVKIYTEENLTNTTELKNEHEVYTVEMLLKKISVNGNCYPIALEADEMTVEEDFKTNESSVVEESEDGWVQSKAFLEWKNCPIGVLPWQRDMVTIDFTVAGDISWTSSQPIQPHDNLEVELQSLSKKINWEEIEQSKRSKKQKLSISSLVKNAFETVGFSGIDHHV